MKLCTLNSVFWSRDLPMLLLGKRLSHCPGKTWLKFSWSLITYKIKSWCFVITFGVQFMSVFGGFFKSNWFLSSFFKILQNSRVVNQIKFGPDKNKWNFWTMNDQFSNPLEKWSGFCLANERPGNLLSIRHFWTKQVKRCWNKWGRRWHPHNRMVGQGQRHFSLPCPGFAKCNVCCSNLLQSSENWHFNKKHDRVTSWTPSSNFPGMYSLRKPFLT